MRADTFVAPNCPDGPQRQQMHFDVAVDDRDAAVPPLWLAARRRPSFSPRPGRDGFAEVCTAHDNRATMGGQFFPNGKGAAVSGGYRLSGSFGSPTGHSPYVAADFLLMGAGGFRWAGDGHPRYGGGGAAPRRGDLHRWPACPGPQGHRVVRLPSRRRVRPCGAHVPAVLPQPLRGASPVARMGLMPVTAAGHAAWALGVAKSMLDDMSDLAATKFRVSDMASPASRPALQKGLARHTVAWRARPASGARRVHHRRIRGRPPAPTSPPRYAPTCGWPPSNPPTPRGRAPNGPIWWRAPTRSARAAAFERAFRDTYTGTQHAFISENRRRWPSTPRRIWLGIIEDQPGLRAAGSGRLVVGPGCRLRVSRRTSPRRRP